MNKKILILGSTGLIGHQVYNYLKRNSSYTLANIAYRKKLTDDSLLLDVRNENALKDAILSVMPDYIVNCVGILIKGSNRDPQSAIFINAYMPHALMRIAESVNAKLVHISTDCVFSGAKGQYIESDFKDGKDIYAKTKGLGEIINDRHVTLRTSVVGPELKTDGEELFHWFMSQSGEINGFSKALWSGVTTIELAKAVLWAIDSNITGLYHVTNGTPISKYELLELFRKETKKNIVINKIDGPAIDKSFIDTRKEMNYSIPPYATMIKNMVDLIRNDRDLYAQYEVH
jgi:dTDP-4-dehydrorhamnose reductase